MTARDTVTATRGGIAGGTATIELAAELHRCRALVHAATKAAVPRLSTALRAIVEYHLGWVDVDGRPTSGDGGKLLRGCMAVLSAEVAGSPPEVGAPGAVALELVHNFSLLHDDVVDLDRERRHRPTAWTVFGVGPTIVAGDALLATAIEVLLDVGSPGAPPAAAALLRATSQMIDGQARDTTFQVRHDLTVADVLEMFRLKTGALFGAAASVGALLAGADPTVVDALRRYGTSYGVAFQVIDDLLGTFGDQSVTGKDVGGDVRRRKLTLPLATALTAKLPEAEELRAIMSADATLDGWHVARATRLIEMCGGRDLAERCAAEHHAAAIEALDSIQSVAVPPAWETLRQITVSSLRRTY